jgi:hypothetical protein
MADDPLFILMVVAMGGVLIVLLFGLSAFARGGDFSKKYSNRAMRWRVMAQFVAVIVILFFVGITGGR